MDVPFLTVTARDPESRPRLAARAGAGSQRNHRNFRRTVQAYRHPDRANAAIRVQGQRTDPSQSPGIFPSQQRQNRSAHDGQAHLAAMRVPRKLKIHGIVSYVIGPIRLMDEQNNRLVCGDIFQGEAEVGLAVENIIHSGEPKPFSHRVRGAQSGCATPGCRWPEGRRLMWAASVPTSWFP